jgi:hypothetical protein
MYSLSILSRLLAAFSLYFHQEGANYNHTLWFCHARITQGYLLRDVSVFVYSVVCQLPFWVLCKSHVITKNVIPSISVARCATSWWTYRHVICMAIFNLSHRSKHSFLFSLIVQHFPLFIFEVLPSNIEFPLRPEKMSRFISFCNVLNNGQLNCNLVQIATDADVPWDRPSPSFTHLPSTYRSPNNFVFLIRNVFKSRSVLSHTFWL